MHERLREHAMRAWEALQKGQPNPLVPNLAGDAEIGQYVSPGEIVHLMDATRHLGDAPERTRRLAADIRAALESQTA
jgi:adenylosuccinate lyase